jgi:hypothetical protein
MFHESLQLCPLNSSPVSQRNDDILPCVPFQWTVPMISGFLISEFHRFHSASSKYSNLRKIAYNNQNIASCVIDVHIAWRIHIGNNTYTYIFQL